MRCRELFATFFKIGLLTIGGGYAMVPVIQEAVVKEHSWLTDEEFIDALALSQSAPGALAINSSVYIGYKLRGFKGALVAALGTALPSFIIILLISLFFFELREIDYVEKAFKGVRAAVVSMIALSLVQLMEAVKLKAKGYAIFVIAAIALVVFDVNPLWVLLAGGAGSFIHYSIKGGSGE